MNYKERQTNDQSGIVQVRTPINRWGKSSPHTPVSITSTYPVSGAEYIEVQELDWNRRQLSGYALRLMGDHAEMWLYTKNSRLEPRLLSYLTALN